MIDVTCALIRNEEDEILVVQRGEKTDHPFKWEFPGGKVKCGESEEECIIREIKEELSMDIVICKRLTDVEYDYGIKKIRLIPFVCDTLDELPFLAEHIAYKWVKVDDLLSVDFSEADVFVAGDYLKSCVEKTSGLPQSSDVGKIDEEEIMRMVSGLTGVRHTEWISKSVIDNPVLVKKFIDYSLSAEKKLASHASWILTKVCDTNPEIIEPYLPGIIDSLHKIENESALRSMLRILSFSDFARLSPKHQGILTDTCFKLLNSGFTAIAAKAYSMEILYRLTLIYPELATELALSVRSLLNTESAGGIVSKGRSVLKRLNQ